MMRRYNQRNKQTTYHGSDSNQDPSNTVHFLKFLFSMTIAQIVKRTFAGELIFRPNQDSDADYVLKET